MSQHINTQQRLHLAFTLIELLVCVSIIAILAALLLPAIGLVKDRALQARCASSLRQLPMAAFAYGADWDGAVLPNATGHNGTWGNGLQWQELIRDYVDNGNAASEVSGSDERSVDQGMSKAGMTVIAGCPAWIGHDWRHFGNDGNSNGYWLNSTPSRNIGDPDDDASNSGISSQAGYKMFSLSSIRHQSRRAMFIETDDFSAEPMPSRHVIMSPTPWTKVSPRHRTSLNYAFFDGRVSMVTTEEHARWNGYDVLPLSVNTGFQEGSKAWSMLFRPSTYLP